MEDAAPPRARPLDQPLPCAGLGAHRDGRLRLPSFPGCSYPCIQLRAKWPSGGATRTPAGFPGLDNLGGTSGPGEREMHASGVCARARVCVCVCVDRRKSESEYSSPSTWPDSAGSAQSPVAGGSGIHPRAPGSRRPCATTHSDFCQPLSPGHFPFPFTPSPFARF